MTDTPIDREARDFLSKNQGRNPLTWQEAAQIADAACCIIRAILEAKEAAEAERNRQAALADYWELHAGRAEDRAEALETKLAVAVEGLKRIERQPDYRLPTPQEIARATLAQIQKEPDNDG